MKQNQETSCLPGGFAVAGTYCGVCRSRIKMDLALLTSRTDCAIVMTKPGYEQSYTGKAVLVHHGVALPDGERGLEITNEICQAAAYHLGLEEKSVQFFAYGMGGQFFRPSLVVQSLNTLCSGLTNAASEAVEKVIDTFGDVSHAAVSVGAASFYGVAADGMRHQPGLCLVLTDGIVAVAQMEQAIAQCRKLFSMEEYVILSMANGASNHAVTDAALIQAMQQMCSALGFQRILRDAI